MWYDGTYSLKIVLGTILCSFGMGFYVAPALAYIIDYYLITAPPGSPLYLCLVWLGSVSSLWIFSSVKKVNWKKVMARFSKAKIIIKKEGAEITLEDKVPNGNSH